jgi:hypothetical protein
LIRISKKKNRRKAKRRRGKTHTTEGERGGANKKRPQTYLSPSQNKITVVLLSFFGSAMQAHLTWQRSINKIHRN